MSTLSAYELERLDNIKKNNEHLQALGLAPGDGVVPALKAGKSSGTDAKVKRKRDSTATENEGPQRRSSRLQNVAAPKVYVEEEVDEVSTKKGLRAVRLGGQDAEAVLAEADAEDADAMPIEPEQLTPTEREVYELIREARNAKARSMERSMFIVCGNRTMVEMCRVVPSSAEELLELHGMGQLKVQRYGELLLSTLRPHAEKLHAEHAAMASAAREREAKSAAAGEGKDVGDVD